MLTITDHQLLASIGATQAAKALSAWRDARDSAFRLAAQAITAGTDRAEVIDPLRGLCTQDQLDQLAAM